MSLPSPSAFQPILAHGPIVRDGVRVGTWFLDRTSTIVEAPEARGMSTLWCVDASETTHRAWKVTTARSGGPRDAGDLARLLADRPAGPDDVSGLLGFLNVLAGARGSTGPSRANRSASGSSTPTVVTRHCPARTT